MPPALSSIPKVTSDNTYCVFTVVESCEAERRRVPSDEPELIRDWLHAL